MSIGLFALGHELFNGGDGNGGPMGRHVSLGHDPSQLNTFANYAARTGRTGFGNRVSNQMSRLGIAADPSQGVDFNDPNFDQSQTAGLRRALSQRSIAAGRGPMHAGALGKKLDIIRQENTQREGRNFFNSTIDPALASAESGAQGLVDHPTFSATDLATQRGQIISGLTGDFENRMRETGAALGNAGMDPNTPAGAAVLGRLKETANADLEQQLSAFNLNVSDIERTNKAQNLGLLTSLATQRMAAHAAINDPSRLFELNDQLNALMESLRAQKSAEEYQRGLARSASGRDWLGTGISAAGALAAPFTMGLSGLAAGGVNAARGGASGLSGGDAFLNSARSAGYGG